jgi:hypothetical protein
MGYQLTSQALDPTIQDYANIFGPVALNIQKDTQRDKRFKQPHLPDALSPSKWFGS